MRSIYIAETKHWCVGVNLKAQSLTPNPSHGFVVSTCFKLFWKRRYFIFFLETFRFLQNTSKYAKRQDGSDPATTSTLHRNSFSDPQPNKITKKIRPSLIDHPQRPTTPPRTNPPSSLIAILESPDKEILLPGHLDAPAVHANFGKPPPKLLRIAATTHRVDLNAAGRFRMVFR